MCCRLWKWEVSYSFCFFFASSWVTMHLSQRPARSLQENPWPAACYHTVPMGGNKLLPSPRRSVNTQPITQNW